MQATKQWEAQPKLTVAENTVELVLCQKGKPAHSVPLILPQIGFDWNGNFILLCLAAVQQLHKELSLFVSLGQELVRKAWRIRNTGLWHVSADPHTGKSIGLTSRGTILTNDANVLVDKSRVDSSGSLILPRIGTIRNRTYGRTLISSVLMTSAYGQHDIKHLRVSLTVYRLNGTLSRRHPLGIADHGHDIVHEHLHPFFSHDVAYRREALGCGGPSQGVRAGQRTDK